MTITVSASPGAAAAPEASAPALPTRDGLVALLERGLWHGRPQRGLRAAWQGASGAVETWRHATGADDLDIWADEAAADALDVALSALPAARVQHATDPRRLRHTSYAVETTSGVAVIDVTRGSLMVGPVMLVPDAEITTESGRLTGVAAAADLLVRPLLRGKVPAEGRLQEARVAWRAVPPVAKEAFIARLRRQLGVSASAAVATALDSTSPVRSDVAITLRRSLLRVTVRPRNLVAAWGQRSVVVPAGRHAGPLGLRTRGALVVLVGTDGSGKSTVAAEIAERLDRLGVRTTTAHIGMARGNLPGVTLARRLLGVAPAGDQAEAAPSPPPPIAAPTGTAPPPLDHPRLRRAAAWFYAVEYAVRWARDVRPGLRHGGVVIADRYVYDLRESPWPGSRASRVAERVLPRPHVLVLPDAPAEQIHARKPERPLSEQRDQQARFRDLLDEGNARIADVVVDTSGRGTADDVARAVAAVLEALHRS